MPCRGTRAFTARREQAFCCADSYQSHSYAVGAGACRSHMKCRIFFRTAPRRGHTTCAESAGLRRDFGLSRSAGRTRFYAMKFRCAGRFAHNFKKQKKLRFLQKIQRRQAFYPLRCGGKTASRRRRGWRSTAWRCGLSFSALNTMEEAERAALLLKKYLQETDFAPMRTCTSADDGV